MKTKYILGIDTSNYKTSVAIIDSDYKIIYDSRRFLKVKKGERGLRQSEALFQHIQNIPQLMSEIPVDLAGNLSAVAYSDRPRPVEGSYMPVFNAAAAVAKSIAAVAEIPALGFSHQEGHIEAILGSLNIVPSNPFIACHFSGGTTEILLIKPRMRDVVLDTGVFYDIELIGGSKDIAMGQVIDRCGVALGMSFPSGEYLDQLAMSSSKGTRLLTPIKVYNGAFNLSGIDTQIKRTIEGTSNIAASDNTLAAFAYEIFMKLSTCVETAIFQASEMTGIKNIIMAGGVSSSKFFREHINSSAKLQNCQILFGSSNLSQDNAVGTAILGGRYAWD